MREEVSSLIQVNLPAVVIASATAMGVGFAWYSTAVFGKRWMELQDLDKGKMAKLGMARIFGITFLVTLVSAYILSLFIHYAGAYNVLLGAKTGLWAWLGFAMPMTLANHLFTRKPFQLYLIQAGHHLVALMVMGAILAVWF